MDNQRTLFKKFFNNSSSSNSSNNTSSGGFNPPKFQFNKKKLGLGLINKPEEVEVEQGKKIIKEIESVEIESEMIQTEHMEIDSIPDTEMDSVVTTVADTLVTNATWSTLNTTNNTMNTLNTMKITNNNDNNTNKMNNLNTVTSVNKIHDANRSDHHNKSVSLMYSNTLEKNRDKYNLSNQLETFCMQLEVFESEIEEKRVKMDLLILSFEEKLVQCNNFHLDMDILL